MLTLNLVSEEQKKEIKLRHIYLFVKKINLTLIIITIAVAIVLLAAKTVLQLRFNTIVEQTSLVTKNNQGYNVKVREINNKITFVSNIQDEFIPWSNLLKIISAITPRGVSLYYLKIDSTGQTIKIKGKADLREDLLDFKNKMEATAVFKNIDFPIKNILEKENIDFEINAKMNLPNLQ